MLKTAPCPKDVQDLQFKLRCRLKVFNNSDGATFSKHCSLVACASRFGLIFVGTNTANIQVIKLKDIEECTLSSGDKADCPRRNISLPSPPTHVSVNCEHAILAIVIERNNCPCALFYDVKSFWQKNVSQIGEVRLSATPSVYVTEVNWNPALGSIFTACKSDGSLGTYEIKNGGIDINELPAAAGATCFCWSPKGKQIAVGSRDGKITQYKPDLKAVKVINAPPLKEPHSLQNLQWVSNYQFIGVFQPANPDNQANFIVIDAPKTGDPTYVNYDDICYSNGNTRPVQFYTVLLHNWNILMAASSNSMEVGILGNSGESWTQWIMGDAARAELPLSADHQETLPVGCAIDIGNTQPLPWGESTIPPVPFLLLLSHHGTLCVFNVINLKEGVPTICTPPDPISDTSGLQHFVSTGGESNRTVENLPKQATTVQVTQPVPQVTNPEPPKTTPTVTSTPSTPSLFKIQPNIAPQNVNQPQSQGINLFGGQATLTPVAKDPKNTSQTGSPYQPLYPSIGGQATLTPVAKEVKNTSQIGSPYQSLYPSIPAESKTVGQSVQTIVSTKPVSVTPPTTPKTVATVVTSTTVPKSSQSEKTEDTISVDSKAEEEAEKIFAQMIREECIFLESELKAVLHQGKALKLNLGTDDDKTKLVESTHGLEEFFNELVDICTSQNSEVHILKQNLLQSWAWYEEVKSRHLASEDESMLMLMRAQPLDSASEKQLADIRHANYYLESQIAQAHAALDEQWENFQDYCKKKHKIQIPTMEMIFQTMVKQNAILKKQSYILKDIANRIKNKSRSAIGPSLLLSMSDIKDLPDELKRLRMDPDDICQIQHEHVLKRMKTFTKKKADTLRTFLKKREYPHISAVKPQLSSSIIQSSPSMKSQLSMLAAKTSPVKTLDFAQSTPKPTTTTIKFKAPLATTPIQGLQNFALNFEAKNFTNLAEKTFTPLTKNVIAGSPNSAFVSTSLGSNTATSTPGAGTYKLGFLAAASLPTNKLSPSLSTVTATPKSFSSQPPPVSDLQKISTNLFATSMSPTTVAPMFPVATKTVVATTTKPSTSVTSGLNLSTTTKVSDNTTNISSKSSTSSFGFGLGTPSAATITAQFSSGNKASTGNTFSGTTKATEASVSTGFMFSTKTPVTVSTAVTNRTVSSTTSQPATTVVTTTNQRLVVKTVTTTVSPLSTSTQSSATSTLSTSTTSLGALKSSIFPTPALSPPKVTTSSPVVTTSSSAVTTVTTAANVFSTSSATSQSSIFGSVISTPAATTSFTFGGTPTSKPLFGSADTSVSKPSIFASTDVSVSKPSIFGNAQSVASTILNVPKPSIFSNAQAIASTEANVSKPSIFGNAQSVASTELNVPKPSIFSNVQAIASTEANVSKPSIFGNAPTVAAPTTISGTTDANVSKPSIFASVQTLASTTISGTSDVNVSKPSIFGNTQNVATTTEKPSIFGNAPTVTSTTTPVTTAPGISKPSIFGQVPSSAPTSAVFGSAATPTTQLSLFGATPPISAATTAQSVFGSSNTNFGSVVTTTQTSVQPSIFGSPPTSQPSVFASAVTTAQSSIFAATPASTTSQSPAFGIFGDSAQKPSLFGSPTTVTTQSSIFGNLGTAPTATGTAFAQNQPSTFGQSSVFGSSDSTFGNTNAFSSTPAFGQSKSLFGPAPTTTSGSIFGATSTAGSTFGSSGSVFGTPVSSTPSLFGSPSVFSPTTTQSSTFGGNTGSGTFGFGGLNVGAPATTTSSGFGGAPAANPFGSDNKSIFGGSAVSSSGPVFGSSSGSLFSNTSQSFGSGFGGQSTFGQQSSFGQSTFGSSTFGQQSSGPFSSGGGSVGQAGFGASATFQKPSGFGASPVFGGSPAFGSPPSFGGAPTFGGPTTFGSTAKVFGGGSPGFGATPNTQNTAFGNLANQQTVGFGNLAQQAANAPSSNAPFSGSSSFSSWR